MEQLAWWRQAARGGMSGTDCKGSEEAGRDLSEPHSLCMVSVGHLGFGFNLDEREHCISFTGRD